MLKAGVIGAGQLGKIHLQQLQKSTRYELVGFHDHCPKNAQKVHLEFGYTPFKNIENLIDAAQVLIIVSNTINHYQCAKQALEKRKHIFVEKPITETIEQAKELITLAKQYSVKGQVGHIERYNPAWISVTKNKLLKNPMFIEMHRLTSFDARGTDVPVVLDLMIHDIDIVLSVVNSPVKEIKASGVAVISGSPDIANARIEFENKCVANLTASRISLKKMRKSRFFQKDAYISINFLEKKSEMIRIKPAPKQPDEFAMILQNAEGIKKQLLFENPPIENNNAILSELECFADAIENNTKPIVDLEQGMKALQIAIKIMQCL